MGAIEKITSKTKEIHIAGAGDEMANKIEVPVWNSTVANLTLMALGEFSCVEGTVSCHELKQL